MKKGIKLLVTGSRTWKDREIIKKHLTFLRPKEVIHGGAGGADALTDDVARELEIHVTVYLADWNKYGKAAGPIRNREMLDKEKPDMVMAFWDGHSRGTKNTIMLAQERKIPTVIVDKETEEILKDRSLTERLLQASMTLDDDIRHGKLKSFEEAFSDDD